MMFLRLGLFVAALLLYVRIRIQRGSAVGTNAALIPA